MPVKDEDDEGYTLPEHWAFALVDMAKITVNISMRFNADPRATLSLIPAEGVAHARRFSIQLLYIPVAATM